MSTYKRAVDPSHEDITASHIQRERDSETFQRNLTLRELRDSGACCSLCALSIQNKFFLTCEKKNKLVQPYNVCEFFYK